MLHFIVRVHETVKETQADIRRSNITKQVLSHGLRSFGSRFFNREAPLQLRTSNSVASFRSISSESIKNSSCTITGHYNVCDVQDFVKSSHSTPENLSLELYQSEWETKKKMFGKTALVHIGRLNVQTLYLETQDEFGTALLPHSISSYRDDMTIVNLHRKVWMDGFLFQLGGDCEV